MRHGATDESHDGLDAKRRLSDPVFGGGDGYELYEDDGEFVLTVELPGFDRDAIDVNWFEGRLTVSAERTDEERNRHRTYHRTFRMPKEIDPDGIAAEYRNGILEVRLPAVEGAPPRGTAIEVE